MNWRTNRLPALTPANHNLDRRDAEPQGRGLPGARQRRRLVHRPPPNRSGLCSRLGRPICDGFKGMLYGSARQSDQEPCSLVVRDARRSRTRRHDPSATKVGDVVFARPDDAQRDPTGAAVVWAWHRQRGRREEWLDSEPRCKQIIGRYHTGLPILAARPQSRSKVGPVSVS